MVYDRTVSRDSQIIFLYGRALYGRQLPVCESVQLPDVPVKFQCIFIETSVINRVSLFHIRLIILRNIGHTAGTGILIHLFYIVQDIKPGDPVSRPGAHTQTVLDGRASRVRTADDPAVSFLCRGNDLRLCIASADHAAFMPSGNSSGPGAERRMIIGSLNLSGHVTVLDQGSALRLADNPADRHKSSHRHVH